MKITRRGFLKALGVSASTPLVAKIEKNAVPIDTGEEVQKAYVEFTQEEDKTLVKQSYVSTSPRLYAHVDEKIKFVWDENIGYWVPVK